MATATGTAQGFCRSLNDPLHGLANPVDDGELDQLDVIGVGL